MDRRAVVEFSDQSTCFSYNQQRIIQVSLTHWVMHWGQEIEKSF